MSAHSPLDRRESAPGQGFFDVIRRTGIVRASEAPVAGVCGGIATRYGLDPLLVRVVAVVITIVTSPLFYGAAWMLLPDSSGRSHLQRALDDREFPAGFVGALALILIGIPTIFPAEWNSNGTWTFRPLPLIVLIVAGVWLWRRSHGSCRLARTDRPTVNLTKAGPATSSPATPAPPASAEPSVAAAAAPTDPTTASVPVRSTPPPMKPATPAAEPGAPAALTPAQRRTAVARRRPGWRSTMLGTGLAALIGAAVYAVSAFGLDSRYATVYGLGAAAVVLGLVTVGNGLRGRTGGLPATLGVAAVIAALFVPSGVAHDTGWRLNDNETARSALDDVTLTPTTLRDARHSVAVGDFTLDLRDAQPGSDPAAITINGGLGDTTVVIPDDLGVDVTVTGGLGDVQGVDANGAPHRVGRDDGRTDATIRITTGIGDVTVEEVSR